MAARALIAAFVIAGSLGSAGADPTPGQGGDFVAPPPPTYKASGVTVEEHLGAQLPVDARFRDLDGKVVTLGEVLKADVLPTILTFNYSDCPLLCSLQLNGLTATMPKVAEGGGELALRPGAHYRIVTISLEPTESLAKLAKMKERYVERLPEAQRAEARRGWTFLAAEIPGDGAAIRRVAETVGFKYTYIAERAEWAHPSAFIFVSTSGAVTRYVYGFDLEPTVLRESIIKAGMSEPATAAGFMHVCYFYDPDASNHSRAGVTALRIGAASFVVLLLSGLGLLHFVRRNHRREMS